MLKKLSPVIRAGMACMLLSAVTNKVAHAQSYDSLIYSSDSSKTYTATVVPYADRLAIYRTPKLFSFVTLVPKTIGLTVRESFGKKSLPIWGAMVGSTAILLAVDYRAQIAVEDLCHSLGISADTKYKTLVGFRLGSKDVPVYQLPQNVNTAFYAIGEGFTSIAISGGMYAYGKIARDRRAVQTASQLVQVQLAVGVITQAIKRITGRESPFAATSPTGIWRPFPSFKEFSANTPRYDAFPSGHMATMMATVTVLADNYPEKRWIRPVGYTIMSLVGVAMMNNGVHWASDYPLAIGIGYVCGKVTVKMNRLVRYRYHKV